MVRIDDEPVGGATTAEAAPPRVVVDIRFDASPTAVNCRAGRTVLTATHNDIHVEVATDSVITAIGFVDSEAEGKIFTDPESFTPRLWVGGCDSGVLGTLADNRTIAKQAAAQIAAVIPQSASGKRGIDGLRDRLPPGAIDFADWRVIDAAEVQRAAPRRCRTTFTTRDEMAATVFGTGFAGARAPAGSSVTMCSG